MSVKDEYIKNIRLENLFDEEYVVPIYQRNYAWGSKQIEQLIDDILDVKEQEEFYYIGTLIVNNRAGKYEVVDGQQRLTTLFLMMSYLNMEVDKTLRFEAREQSNRLLEQLSGSTDKSQIAWKEEHEIIRGYELIVKLFRTKRDANNNSIDINEFIKKLKKVHIVRVQVPQNINLNHYFEIMNTRGEQLELHEIAKSKFLSRLGDREKVVASLIWEACANMDSYLHMNLSVSQKEALLTENRDELKNEMDCFDTVVERLNEEGAKGTGFSLEQFWVNPQAYKVQSGENAKREKEDEEFGSKRFDSIIGFPQFLLHVNAAMVSCAENQTEDNEDSLDDKRLLVVLQSQWATPDKAKKFLFELLRYRLLFDKYIIKRDKKLTEEGKWSLKRTKKYSAKKSVYYVGTFNDCDTEDEEIDESYNDVSVKEAARNFLTLQSALRITYTSPKTMHWITRVLSACASGKRDVKELLIELERYATQKVGESGYRNKQNWWEYQRIVFSYLDYILYRDGYEEGGIGKQPKEFEFIFRSSIEHFYPQNPITGERCPDAILHCLGNLALITVSGNSAVSNLDPASKKKSFAHVIRQSLKLQIMAGLVGDQSKDWIFSPEGLEESLAKKHEKAMYELLDREMEKYYVRNR